MKFKTLNCIVLIHLFLTYVNSCRVPDVTIQAYTDGEFRAHFKTDDLAIQTIEFRANINHDMEQNDSGRFSAYVNMTDKKYGIAIFQNAETSIGDKIYFWVIFYCNDFADQIPGMFIIRDQTSTNSEQKSNCIESVTTINDGKKICVGDIIIYDDFQRSGLDTSRWFIEHWIPTYTPPKFLFNSFENNNYTIYTREGKLHIKPIPVEKSSHRQSSWDLRKGCTSMMPDECYISSQSKNVVPAVKSAKIILKTSFRYGKVEIKAKLPAGEWIYPIMQLEQKVKENGENSPTIWIAYSRGNRELIGNDKENDLGACIIFGGPVLYQLEPLRSQKLATKRNPNPFYADFHLYTLEWKPGKMTFSIDDEQFGLVELTTLRDNIDVRSGWKSPEAPFDKEFLLSLGVAIGGLVDFPDGFVSSDHQKPWINSDKGSLRSFWEKKDLWIKTWNESNSVLQVDYVKITAI